MQIKQFKIRCSQIGQIMGIKGLGKTGETYLKDWLKSQIFNRQIEIKSKYLQKGNACEDWAIDFLADQFGIDLLKNEIHFENDYFTGTPDLITSDCIIDIKNSWDWPTFPYLDTENKNYDYELQLQGYMNLTGIKKAKLIYFLSDTPDELIEKEAYYYCKSIGLLELDFDIFEKFKAKMTYSDIPDLKRYKVFEFEFNPILINSIENRVLESRKYLEQFKQF